MAEAAARRLVLLHGWAMTPRVWDGMVAALPAGFEIHAPALPCHPGGVAAAPTLGAWADALATTLPDDAVVCGWSLGAMLAMALAIHHPRKARRLVLTGATPRFVAGEGWEHGLQAEVVGAFRQGFADAPSATLRRFLSLQTQGDARRKAVQSALSAALARGDDADAATDTALATALGVLADADLRAELPTLRQPALLIHGDGDALMPLAGARALAASLPAAELLVCEATGHAPFVADPAAFAARLAAFADV